MGLRKIPVRGLATLLGLTTIGCDRVTKHLAAIHLAGEPARSYFHDVMRLDYAENTGAFLSLGASLSEQARVVILTGGVAALLLVVGVLAVVRRWRGTILIGAVLMWAGGLSNLIDRARYGSVVDFVSIGWGPLRTGIFNVADVAIMIGAVLILFGETTNTGKVQQH